MSTNINSNTNQKIKYSNHFQNLSDKFNDTKAAEIAVGGSFDKIGRIELEILKNNGLKKEDFIIDIGCGSGRLTKQLANFGVSKYLGTDILPELLEHARKFTPNNDWTLSEVNNLIIPAEDGIADFVCFFSVFTHLLHEQTFLYLKEAKRVLKQNGKIIFSFLEFAVPSHWIVFETNLGHYENNHLNMFIEQNTIKLWAMKLGLSIQSITRGDNNQIINDIEGDKSLGQSIAVATKT